MRVAKTIELDENTERELRGQLHQHPPKLMVVDEVQPSSCRLSAGATTVSEPP